MHNDDIKPDANSHVDPAWDKDPLWYKDAIIYELHVKAFFDSKQKILYHRIVEVPRSVFFQIFFGFIKITKRIQSGNHIIHCISTITKQLTLKQKTIV